jgi:deoxyribose-phosphate aldolase
MAALVDHTLLRAEATENDILRLCDEAVELALRTVCVNGQWVGQVARRLDGTSVLVAAVVGFPLGASGLKAKAAETAIVVDQGAREIDMVISLGRAKAGQWEPVREEIAAVVGAAPGCLVKAILETAALTPEEIDRGCRVALEGGARMVKTSTGFHPLGGATVEAVRRMRRVVGLAAGVKASGGIRTADDARRMLLAGADRLGASSAGTWGDALHRRLDQDLTSHDLR